MPKKKPAYTSEEDTRLTSDEENPAEITDEEDYDHQEQHYEEEEPEYDPNDPEEEDQYEEDDNYDYEEQ